MIRPLCAAAVWTACALVWTARAQTAPAPSFEVASVKPAAAMPGKGGDLMKSGGDPGRIDDLNFSLRELVRQAYQLKDYQIVAPEWLGTERYDVMAKVPHGTSAEQKWAMLQNLLADRFQLKVHREKKDLPAYALEVAKGGPKLEQHVDAPEDAAGGPSPDRSSGNSRATQRFRMRPDGTPKPLGGRFGIMLGMGRMIVNAATLGDVADLLSRMLGKPVVDETGLTAKYDFMLQWTPEPGEGPMLPIGKMMAREDAGAGSDGNGRDAAVDSLPPLPVALQQQLGLRLEPKRLPLDVIVVDHAEKAPTEN